MAETLLRTKLYVPPVRPNLVHRRRLLDRLDRGVQFGQKLTLVSAPAGFGKTTLASEWAANSEMPAAWLSLDEGDNDSTRFVAYIIAALQTLVLHEAGEAPAQIGEGALGMLQSPHPPAPETVLTTLLNEIVTVQDDFALILDDYHLIDAQAVDDTVSFLLDNLPPQMHLVIITREDPHLPLSRMRARGKLTEIRAVDLRFSSAEAAQFLNQAMGLNLAAEDIGVLEMKTEGWIAGLSLAAISMQGRRDTSDLIQSFTGSHRFVLDYLIEEVLEQQPEELQTFLLSTAVLNKLTGPLCDALTNQDNGWETLERLERANLFVVPLDEERCWYRYHHLFADLLHQRLQQTDPDLLPALHLRASMWYEENGFIDEAIEHALQKEDFERAADIIAEYIDDDWQYGERKKLQRWLVGLPEELIEVKPQLCILYARILFTRGQISESERYIQAAEAALGVGTFARLLPASKEMEQRLDPEKKQLWGRMATVQSGLVSYRGDEEGSIQYAKQALRYLPKSDLAWRSSALDLLASAYSVTGDAVSAFHTRLGAIETSKAAGNAYITLYTSLRLVVTLRDLGRLQQAIELCEEQLSIAKENGLSQTALVGWLYALWGEILAEKHELEQARELAIQGVNLTDHGKDVILLSSSTLCLLRVLFSQRDWDEAAAIIQAVNGHTPEKEMSPWITNQMAAWQARIWLAQGKLDRASRWAEESEFDVDDALLPLHDFDYVVLARILTAEGRLDEAGRLLQRLYEAAEAGGRISKAIELLVLQALVYQAKGDVGQALGALEAALDLAEPGGFTGIFVDEGPAMAHLLSEAQRRGVAPQPVRRLLAAFEGTGAGPDGALPAETPGSELIEPLSERELEVLHCIAEGLSNREIANRLYLSLNTVKVHARNIYGKLGAHRRTEAVARAKALGVLPSI